MSDGDRNSAAWRITPSAYLDTRPAVGRVGRRVQIMSTMRDGCRLAVDVYLPPDAPARVPTILILTPYYRRFALAPDAPAGPRPRRVSHAGATCSCRAAMRWWRWMCAAPARASAPATASAPRANARITARSPTWVVSPALVGRADRRDRDLLCRRRLRFPRQHRASGGARDRAAVGGVGHVRRSLLPGRVAAGPAGAILRFADGGARS